MAGRDLDNQMKHLRCFPVGNGELLKDFKQGSHISGHLYFRKITLATV